MNYANRWERLESDNTIYVVSQKTNKLELKFYNNVERHRRVYEQKTIESKQVKNFYEFYIDGKSLISEIGKTFWSKQNAETFFDDKVGYLGAFNEETDLVFLVLLYQLELETEIRKFIESNMSCKLSGTKMSTILEEINEEKIGLTLLYGCSCGDTYCQGIGVEIKKEDDFYYWTLGEENKVLFYKFEAKAYENELNKVLKDKNRYF